MNLIQHIQMNKSNPVGDQSAHWNNCWRYWNLKKDDTTAEENNPQFLMTEVLPPIGVPIRVFYINFHGVKLNDIMHVLPEYDINDFRVKDDDSFYGLAYGWSRATDEEIAEYECD